MDKDKIINIKIFERICSKSQILHIRVLYFQKSECSFLNNNENTVLIIASMNSKISS